MSYNFDNDFNKTRKSMSIMMVFGAILTLGAGGFLVWVILTLLAYIGAL